MGGSGAETILRYALHQGADAAIHFFSQEHTETDTWMCARTIARGLSKIPYDLILTGAVSSDTGNGYMPAALAAHLFIPCATQIVGIQKNGPGGLAVVKKLPQGKRETYALDLPAVVGCAPGINVPQYVAPFSRIYRQGEGKAIQTVAVDLSGEKAAPLTRTIKITASKPRVKAGINITALSMADRMKMMRGELGTKKEIFTGSANEGARKMINHAKLDQVEKQAMNSAVQNTV